MVVKLATPSNIMPSILVMVIIFLMTTIIFLMTFSNNCYDSSQEKIDSPSPAPACIGLAHFPAHNIKMAQAVTQVHNRSEYFEKFLGSMNITQGQQKSKKDLCLCSENGANLLPAKSLALQGYSFVIFVGDSLAREAAWSLRRLALAQSNLTQCQPWEPLHHDTKSNPSFQCEEQSNGLSCQGSVQPIDKVPKSCCTKQFLLFRIDVRLETLEQFMNELNTICPCRGIVYIQSAVHVMLRKKSLFGRRESTLKTLSSLVSNNTRNHKFVWASPPALDVIMMELDPPKPDRKSFDSVTSDIWRWMDLDAISTINDSSISYSEQFEVSNAYMGLSCDGMHFGTSYDRALYGCQGMSVVTDVLTQLWLHRVLAPSTTPLSICN